MLSKLFTNACKSAAALCVACGLWSCAHYDVQAPYDAYVCFNSSFAACLNVAQGGQLKNWRKATYKATDQHFVNDPDSGVVHTTTDTKYTCQYGVIPYTQTLDLDHAAPVVFVSSLLLRQLGEQMVRLSRARANCDRVIAGYQYQLGVIAMQDQLSSAQKGTALLSSEVEHDRNLKDSVGSRKLSQQESATYGNATIVRDGLQYERGQVAGDGEQIRSAYKSETTDVDYRYQFEDANFAIDMQLREVARTLVVLDRSAYVGPGSRFTPRHYADGSWVKQGSVVLIFEGSQAH